MAITDNRDAGGDSALAFLAGYTEEYKQNHFTPRATAVGLTPGEIAAAGPVDSLRFIYHHHYAFNRGGGAAAGYNDIAVAAVDTIGGVDPDSLWETFTDLLSY